MAFLDWARRFRRLEPATQNARPIGGSDELDSLIGTLLEDYKGRITGARLKEILESADAGTPQDQALFFNQIQEREPVIAAHMQTRKLAVTGCEWQILASDSDKKRADEITSILKAAGVVNLQKHLLDYIGHGYSAAIIDWQEGGGSISGFRLIHPSQFAFDLEGNPAILDSIGKERGFNEFHPNQFVSCLSNAKPGIPCRNGLFRALAWQYLFKHGSTAGWIRFVEKFGIPFIIGKMSDNDFNDSTKRSALLQQLRKIGSDGAGIVTQSTDMTALNVDGKNEIFRSFAGYSDEMFTLLILGQLASSSTSSGLSGGDAQSQVRRDILEADCNALIDSINRDIVTPLYRFRYGANPPPDFQFWIDYEPAADLKAKAEIYEKITAFTGKMIDPAQVETEFGVKLVDGPEAPPAVAAESVALSDAPRRSPAVSAIDSIVTDALEQTVSDPEVLGSWLDPIGNALKMFSDIDPEKDGWLDEFKARIPAFQAKLPGLLDKMDSKRFERILTDSMISNALNGYTN